MTPYFLADLPLPVALRFLVALLLSAGPLSLATQLSRGFLSSSNSYRRLQRGSSSFFISVMRVQIWPINWT